MQNIFDTAGPIQIIIPHGSDFLNAALRIAHMFDTYLKLDTEIILDSIFDTSPSSSSGRGNLIVIGRNNLYARKVLQLESADLRTDFSLSDGNWLLRGRPISCEDKESIGLLFTHPHPLNPRGLVLFVDGSDDAALERVLRLIAPRTGIAVPDWLIVGEEADSKGMAGVIGAG